MMLQKRKGCLIMHQMHRIAQTSFLLVVVLMCEMIAAASAVLGQVISRECRLPVPSPLALAGALDATD